MKDNQSVLRVLSILQLIASHDEGLTLGEIYRTLGLPKTTVYHMLQTLYKADAIYYKDIHQKNYVIGSTMFAIGSVYAKNSNLIEAGKQALKEFSENTSRVVFITKPNEDKIVYIYKYQSFQTLLRTPEEIGTILDISNDDLLSISYDRFKLPQTSPDYLWNENYIDNHTCIITAPIYNFENRLVGVISTHDIYKENVVRNEIAKSFSDIAKNISKKLGYKKHIE